MKKYIGFILALLLIFALCVPAHAGTASISCYASSSSVKEGETITVTVSMSGNDPYKSIGLSLSYDTSAFDFVSAEWLLSGAALSSPYLNGFASIAYTDAVTNNGNIYSFTLKAKSNVGTQNISVNPVIQNGTESVPASASGVSVKIACTSHSYGAWTEVSAPTCTSNGSEQSVCSACGDTQTRSVGSTGHSWSAWTQSKAPTCTEAGKETRTCPNCNGTEERAISKLGHNYSNPTVTKQPTCTEMGVKTGACSNCFQSVNEPVPATGHSMSSWKQKTAPTCDAVGKEERSCSKCTHKETRDITALGHSFSNPTVTKQPTCTETGTEIGKCTRCGKETQQSIPAKGHTFGSWIEITAATCTQTGSQERTCSVCQAKETRETKALGHNFENPTAVTEATISTVGLMEGKCKVCGKTTQQEIPCSATVSGLDIYLETKPNVFPEGTEIVAEQATEGSSEYENIKTALAQTSKTFTVYKISALLNGEPAEQNGAVNITFPVPEGYGKDLLLYAVAQNGVPEPVEFTFSEDGKTILISTDNLSTYVIALPDAEPVEEEEVNTEEEKIEPDTDIPKEETESNGSLWIWIAAWSAVIVAGIFLFVFLNRKKYAKAIKQEPVEKE